MRWWLVHVRPPSGTPGVFTWSAGYLLVADLGTSPSMCRCCECRTCAGRARIVVTTVSAPSPSPRRPRRHSRRRYAIRRAVAVLILVLAGFGIVQAGPFGRRRWRRGRRRRSGAADTTVASGSAPTVDPLADPVSLDSAGLVDSVVDTTDPEPDTTARRHRRIRPRCSSSATAMPGRSGPISRRCSTAPASSTTELDYKVSSGLARPDFFDWPAEIDAKLPEVDPDIVVATFGGNDAQGLSVANGDFIVGRPGERTRPSGVAEYGRRVPARRWIYLTRRAAARSSGSASRTTTIPR